MSVNKAIILGRLGRDPELKLLTNGTAVCKFSVATTEKWKDKQGEKQEKTEWHQIIAWGKQAELCNQYLSKGREVFIEGKIETRSWDDKEGTKRYSTEIKATTVQFLGGTPKTTEQDVQHEAQPEKQGDLLSQDKDIKINDNFTADDIPF